MVSGVSETSTTYHDRPRLVKLGPIEDNARSSEPTKSNVS